MAGGVTETDPLKLAKYCDFFKEGAKNFYDQSGGDMWFFELYHHLTDCAASFRKCAAADKTERLKAIENWAAAVVRECDGGKQSPSLETLAKLESALFINWKSQTPSNTEQTAVK